MTGWSLYICLNVCVLFPPNMNTHSQSTTEKKNCIWLFKFTFKIKSTGHWLKNEWILVCHKVKEHVFTPRYKNAKTQRYRIIQNDWIKWRSTCTRTWPSASSSKCVNMWNIWLDGWWIVTTTALPKFSVSCFKSTIREYAVLESKPEVGSWKNQSNKRMLTD